MIDLNSEKYQEFYRYVDIRTVARGRFEEFDYKNCTHFKRGRSARKFAKFIIMLDKIKFKKLKYLNE